VQASAVRQCKKLAAFTRASVRCETISLHCRKINDGVVGGSNGKVCMVRIEVQRNAEQNKN
jgi:hypothetical protein